MKKPKQRHLYTPQLHEKNVRKLYRHAQKLNMPMTRLLNLIVSSALEQLEEVPHVDAP